MVHKTKKYKISTHLEDIVDQEFVKFKGKTFSDNQDVLVYIKEMLERTIYKVEHIADVF